MSLTLPARYTTPAIVFHWLVAAGIIFNVLIIWVVDALPEAAQRPTVNLHKSIGITILGLAIMRLLWRVTHKPPALPPGTLGWERGLSHAVHMLLYAMIFVQPITGWLHDSAWKDAAAHPLVLFGFIPWFRIGAVQGMDPATKEQWHTIFGNIHSAGAYALYALVGLHVVGALKHQFWDSRPSLRRMWVS